MRQIIVPIFATLVAVIVGGCKTSVSEPETQAVVKSSQEKNLSVLNTEVEKQREKVSGVESQLVELKGKNASEQDIQKTSEDLEHARNVLNALEERLGHARQGMIKVP